MTLARKSRSARRKTYPNATLSTINPICTGPRSKLQQVSLSCIWDFNELLMLQVFRTKGEVREALDGIQRAAVCVTQKVQQSLYLYGRSAVHQRPQRTYITRDSSAVHLNFHIRKLSCFLMTRWLTDFERRLSGVIKDNSHPPKLRLGGSKTCDISRDICPKTQC
jgi:hypothetical protein